MGFRDGTANLDPADATQMRDNVLAAAGDGAAWMAGGSYLVARRIRIRIEQWDRTTLGEQEQFVGRRKASGAPLGGRSELDTVDVRRLDPAAHIRLANPRDGAVSDAERILAGLQLRRRRRRARPDRGRPLLHLLPAQSGASVRGDPGAPGGQRLAQRVPVPHGQRALRRAPGIAARPLCRRVAACRRVTRSVPAHGSRM